MCCLWDFNITTPPPIFNSCGNLICATRRTFTYDNVNHFFLLPTKFRPSTCSDNSLLQ